MWASWRSWGLGLHWTCGIWSQQRGKYNDLPSVSLFGAGFLTGGVIITTAEIIAHILVKVSSGGLWKRTGTKELRELASR